VDLVGDILFSPLNKYLARCATKSYKSNCSRWHMEYLRIEMSSLKLVHS